MEQMEQLAHLTEMLNSIQERLRALRNELASDTLIETERIVEELDDILGDE